METFFDFLIHSSIAITLFYMIYWLLLRQSTHFRANRGYLVLSLLVAVLISAFPIRYAVIVPVTETPVFLPFNGTDVHFNENTGNTATESTVSPIAPIIFIVYCTGALVVFVRLLIQAWKPVRIIFVSKQVKNNNISIHENKLEGYIPFSFFNHIFINTDDQSRDEIEEIIAHEKVHIQERHWIDLLIIELLTVVFWFNPVIWLFEHAIKLNHEFLADNGVLACGHSPAGYQALLVNQLMGIRIIGFTNNLTFAPGPNRLNMMYKPKTPKRKLLLMAWAIPALGVLLTAFAEPRYQPGKTPDKVTADKQSITASLQGKQVILTGNVTNDKGTPMDGASVIIRGTTTGTSTDSKGNFSLEVPENKETELVISFVGYRSVVATVFPKKEYSWEFKMERELIGIDTKSMFLEREMPSPPPPPAPTPVKNESDSEVFTIVEEMPEYPDGAYGLGQYVKKKEKELKADSFFKGNKLKGKATVGFTVNEKGKVTNIHVIDKTSGEAAKALTMIVNGMSDWSPGKQKGKAVPVDYAMALEF